MQNPEEVKTRKTEDEDNLRSNKQARTGFTESECGRKSKLARQDVSATPALPPRQGRDSGTGSLASSPSGLGASGPGVGTHPSPGGQSETVPLGGPTASTEPGKQVDEYEVNVATTTEIDQCRSSCGPYPFKAELVKAISQVDLTEVYSPPRLRIWHIGSGYKQAKQWTLPPGGTSGSQKRELEPSVI